MDAVRTDVGSVVGGDSMSKYPVKVDKQEVSQIKSVLKKLFNRHCVTRARIQNRGLSGEHHWFAVGLDRLDGEKRKCSVDGYRRRFVDDFYIIIHGDPKVESFYWVIPFNLVKHLFVDETINEAKGTNPTRWVGHLYTINGVLQIGPGDLGGCEKFDASDFRVNPSDLDALLQVKVPQDALMAALTEALTATAALTTALTEVLKVMTAKTPKSQ
jgi:hypothetical protein